MENILTNFDESSKIVIKELVKDNEKLTGLINKLQLARESVDNKVDFKKSINQEIKK